MAAYCLYNAVTVLLNYRHSASGLAVMRIFRDTLEEAFDDAVKAYDAFIADPNSNLGLDQELKKLQQASDLEDELRILRCLFLEQRKVIKRFIHELDRLRSIQPFYGKNAVTMATLALTKLQEYDIEVMEHQKETIRVRNYIVELLDLKQKGAGLEVAQSTWNQGRTMMIFTVFTIVFLPLSFFTSLYGMNIREWSGVNTNPAGKIVMVFMVPISTVVIVLALVVAFFEKIRGLVKRWFGREDSYMRVNQEEVGPNMMRRGMGTARREGDAIV
ncbi:hypothetical protein K440DRAFT_623787 [Wilcoxina mikolae CBS 423.85]|nr:hypothetical protein K440DRAFT_623787 [Wilcoxina mikolae CBS 423.85]